MTRPPMLKINQRIKYLTDRMKERLRVFVESRHPGAENDPETKRFQENIQREAEDLKLESFGIEVRVLYLEIFITYIIQVATHYR